MVCGRSYYAKIILFGRTTALHDDIRSLVRVGIMSHACRKENLTFYIVEGINGAITETNIELQTVWDSDYTTLLIMKVKHKWHGRCTFGRFVAAVDELRKRPV
jgi:hypothetical protein